MKRIRVLNPEQKERAKAAARRWYERNRERIANRSKHDTEWIARRQVLGRARWKRNKTRLSSKRLEWMFGISQEQYDTLFARQGFVCAVCGAARDPDKHAFPVDHCHVTGAIRGILCHKCNRGLGLFNDDAARMRAAAAYLDKPPAAGDGLIAKCFTLNREFPPGK